MSILIRIHWMIQNPKSANYQKMPPIAERSIVVEAQLFRGADWKFDTHMLDCLVST